MRIVLTEMQTEKYDAITHATIRLLLRSGHLDGKRVCTKKNGEEEMMTIIASGKHKNDFYFFPG